MKIWSLGYPRIGKKREWKTSLESYWAGECDAAGLLESARQLCAVRWRRQHELGVDSIPVNDFSFYDHVLEMAYLLGAVPKRFGAAGDDWQQILFGMARGLEHDGEYSASTLR